VILLGRNLCGGGLEMLADLQASTIWSAIPVVLLADDAETTALLRARGLHVSLSVAHPEGKRAFAQFVRSLRNLCETVVAPSLARPNPTTPPA
jgi:hypothetical protein